MKNITKAAITLALGIGILVETAGIASAMPHITDFNGVVEEPVKVEQVVSFDQNRQPEVSTDNQMIGLYDNSGHAYCTGYCLLDNPGLHDSVHCLQNTKMQYHRSMTVLSIHDSVHCLHDGTRDRTTKFFSAGLHNNGAFLPWHPGNGG